MGANWGKNIQLSIFGESHGKAIGINISGLPSGIKIDQEAILKDMERRAPGKSRFATARKESDLPEIISGIQNGVTTGAPLCALIENQNQHSKDYDYLKSQMRPGHSDYPAFMKYKGYNDVRGGGHFSGRLTAPLVFAGALCKQVLKEDGIEVISHIQNVYDIKDESFPTLINQSLINDLRSQEYPLINKALMPDIEAIIEQAKKNKDSVGGSIECAILGVHCGIGDPFFDSIESRLSSLMFSIPGVKGISFGSGFDLCSMYGSESNDVYYYDNEMVKTKTNHNGGIIGGISNGMPLTFTLAIKPTASIGLKQDSINVIKKENQPLEIVGRHDPCIVIRALPVVEAMAAIAILDITLK